ncbi:MAG: hypothetical protein ABR915_12475, partial [Thermoguttaceae bacterium]
GQSEPAPRSAWDAPQRLILVGTVLLLASVAVAIAVYQYRPKAPGQTITPEVVQRNVEQLSPLASIHVFHILVDSGLGVGPKDPSQQEYQTAMDRYRGWLGLLALLGITGAVLIGMGIAGAARARSRTTET